MPNPPGDRQNRNRRRNNNRNHRNQHGNNNNNNNYRNEFFQQLRAILARGRGANFRGGFNIHRDMMNMVNANIANLNGIDPQYAALMGRDITPDDYEILNQLSRREEEKRAQARKDSVVNRLKTYPVFIFGSGKQPVGNQWYNEGEGGATG